MGLAGVNVYVQENARALKEKTPLTPEVLVPRLGDYLVERGLLSQTDLNQALLYQKNLQGPERNRLLGQVLVDLKLISRIDLDQAITEQILQLRSALQNSNRQLERRVQERTAELESALKKLSAVNQLKSNIVSNISHELRTPLTHIEGYLELMANKDLGPLNEEQLRAVHVLLRSADRLERLIEDLILFSMTEREEITLHLTPTRLTDILTSVIEKSHEIAISRKVRLKIICPSELPVVESDSEKLSWVILQLLDNAIKFTASDGTVLLKVQSRKQDIHVSVEDTGIGIPKERINEIFEPFNQLDGSSTRKYGGTGLGLALVKKIIEAHGSRIQVTSEVGKGSKFEFVLKASPKTIEL
jgi:signal transduction histidine kinase